MEKIARADAAALHVTTGYQRAASLSFPAIALPGAYFQGKRGQWYANFARLQPEQVSW